MTRLFPARRRAEHSTPSSREARPDDVDRRDRRAAGARGRAPLACPAAGPARVRRRPARAAACSPPRPSSWPPRRPASRDDVAAAHRQPRRTRRERRLGIALGAVAIIGATTSMAVASQSALPGDALYPLKRAIENTQAGFSVGDDAKGETILGNASGRLDEVDELTRSDQPRRRRWSPDPQHLLRPGHPGRRPAPGRLRAAPATRSRSSSCSHSPRTAWTPRRPRGRRSRRRPTTRCSTPPSACSRSTPRPTRSAPTAATASPRSRRSCSPVPPPRSTTPTGALAGGELPGTARRPSAGQGQHQPSSGGKGNGGRAA